MAVPPEPGKPEAPSRPTDSVTNGAEPPVRIAFLITELDPGGAERALVQVVTRLDRRRWEPRVYCLAPRGALADELEQAGVPVHCFGVRSVLGIGVIFRLAAALRRERPTLLQTWLYHANIVGRLAGRMARVPRIVAGIRVAEKRSRLRLRLDRWTERLVDRHVCVSRGVAAFSAEQGGLSRDKIFVIPNGVDFERFATARPADLGRFGIPPDAETVLFVGRLDPQKRPDLLLDAVLPLLAARPRLHVVFAGEGPLRVSLEERVAGERGDARSRIHFAGWCEDVPGLMRAATVLACPSAWEGMANVVLEAMAAGLPVVAAAVEGMEELVADGRTGRLVPAGDAGAFQAGLIQVLDDPARASAMGEQAQQIVQKDFTWDAVASAYEALYRSLIAGTSSAEAGSFPSGGR